MALLNTRMVTNYANASGASAITSATLPDADPNYPFTNLFVRDRAVKYVYPGVGGGPAQVTFPIRLGGVRTIDIIGLVGLERPFLGFPTKMSLTTYGTYPDPVVTSCVFGIVNGTITRNLGASFPTGLAVGMVVSGTGIQPGTTIVSINGSPPSSAFSITLSLTPTIAAPAPGISLTFTDRKVVIPFNVSPQNTMSGVSLNDMFIQLPTPVTCRYAFLMVENLASAAIGSVLLGKTTDLGIVYAAGSSETDMMARVHNRSADKRLFSTRVGTDSRMLNYLFPKMTATMKDAIRSAVLAAPFYMLTPGNDLFEVDSPDDAFNVTTVWANPELYDVSMNVETMP